MSGKKVTWRALRVGDQMDLDANYGAANRAHLKKYAAYAMRLVTIEGLTPGEKPQVEHLREWDEYDLEAFAEEVAMREMARANALSSKRDGSAVQRLEQSIETAQLSLAKAAEDLKSVLIAAKSVEQHHGPLTPKS